MAKEFNCKGKLLADYLIQRGSKLIKINYSNGIPVFVFEYDESIDKNIIQWETDRDKCWF